MVARRESSTWTSDTSNQSSPSVQTRIACSDYLRSWHFRMFQYPSTRLTGTNCLFVGVAREHVANMYTAADHTGITPIPSTAKMIEPEPEEEAPPPEQPPPANANVAEVSPLLPTPAPVLVEFEAPKRPKGRFPLVRQQTAPAGCLLPPSAPLQPLPLRMNQDRLAELPEFPEVQLRGKSLGRKSRPNSGESTTSSSMDPEATAHAFRKALRSTASKKYQRVRKFVFCWHCGTRFKSVCAWRSQIYQRNNKNLIGDDDVPVELEMALMRRRLSSAPQSSFGGRPPTAASSLFNSPLSSPSSPNSPKSPGTRRQSTQCNEGSSSFPFTGKPTCNMYRSCIVLRLWAFCQQSTDRKWWPRPRRVQLPSGRGVKASLLAK